MKYNKFDIITLEDDKDLIVLEVLEYEGNTYLYVDEVNENETDILGNARILKAYDDVVEVEVNSDILVKLLPLFKQKVKLEKE